MADEQSPTIEIAPTIVLNSNESEIENADLSGEGVEPHSSNEPAQPIGDGVSEPQSEQVAIASIEAERDITLAALHSDVERERIAVEAERIEAVANNNEGIEECRNEIARLTGIVESLTEQVNSLIPPLPLEVVTEELPIAQEPDLIQPDTQALTAEIRTEPLEESVEERPEETIPNRVRRFIAI